MSGLTLAFFAAPYIIALLIGLSLPLLMVASYRSFGAGAAMYAVIFCFNTALPGLAQGGLKLGITLYPTDLVTFLLIIVTLLRFVLRKECRIHNPALYVFTAVLALNTVHGLIVFKAAGGNAARVEVYALTAAIYASTFAVDARMLRNLVRVFLGTALVMVAIAIYRWVVVAFDIRELLPPSGSFQPAGHSVWRVIVSNEALVVGELAVLAWFFSARGKPLQGWQWVAVPMLAMVALLQHRSAWLATLLAAMAALAAVRAVGQAGRRGLGLLVVFGVIAAGAAVLGTQGGGLGGDVARSAADAVELKGTAGERLGSWRQLVKTWAGSGPRVIVLGNPTGTSYERYTSDDFTARRIAYQAHNYFVTVLTAHGLISAFAFAALLLQVLWRLYQAARQPEHQVTAGVLLTLVVGQMGYYLTYGTDFLQWLALGVALSFADGLRRQAAAPQAAAAARRGSRPLFVRPWGA